MLRQTIELVHASIEIEERAGYLFVVETGQLRNVSEVTAYIRAMERVIAKTGIDRAVIDARSEIGEPPDEVRDAMWAWLSAPDRGFTQVAFVLPSEMAVARVNMTALSRRATIRAFDAVQPAQRWLLRGPRWTASVAGVSSGSVPAGDPEPARSPLDEPIAAKPPERRGSSTAFAPTERPPRTDESAHGRPAKREVSPKRGSGQGFRPPTPGPSEKAEGATKGIRAPSERAARESDVQRTTDAAPEEHELVRKGSGRLA